MIQRKIGDKNFSFKLPTVGQLDRYFAKVSNSLTSASINLTIDMAAEDDRAELSRYFEEKPGVAVGIATEALTERGFSNGQSQD
jgi:hypothetical protein